MSRSRLPSRLLLPLLLVGAACRAPFEPVTVTPPGPPPVGPVLPMRIGSTGPDFARAVATDAGGNAYVVSYFASTVDFDGGIGVVSRTAIGPYDIALTKYASDGTFQWVFVIGGADVDVPYNVKLAPDGAIYVTGYVTGGALCSGHPLPAAGGHGEVHRPGRAPRDDPGAVPLVGARQRRDEARQRVWRIGHAGMPHQAPRSARQPVAPRRGYGA